jgi:ATP-dependent DNA ligase
MPSLFIEPCLPTVSRIVPTGRQWAYEINHDGFRFLCARQGERVRVFSRGGHDWSAQLPAIAEALQALSVVSAGHVEDVDGAIVCRQACVMGLEGIVAKRRDSRYRSGRCRDWIKIKNPAHPAIERAMLIALSKRRQR